jgi:hypothetical protein
MQHKDFQKSSSALISFIDIWIDALTNNSSFEREFYLEGKQIYFQFKKMEKII